MIPENVPAPKITDPNADRVVYLDRGGRLVACGKNYFRDYIARDPIQYRGVWDAGVIMRNPIQLIDFLFNVKKNYSVKPFDLYWFWAANNLDQQFPAHMIARIKIGLGISEY